MKKKILIGLALLATLLPAKAILTLKEVDGSPILPDVRLITVNGGTLADLNNGNISIGVNQNSVLRPIVSLGNGGTTEAINWNSGLFQSLQTNAATLTATFTAPAGATFLNLKIRNAGGTINGAVSWPATAKWASGAPPNLSNGEGAVDWIQFFYDGTNYYGDKVLLLQ